MSDEEVCSLVMQRMKAIALPDRKVPAAPVRIVRTRWAQDPYALGAYSHWCPGNQPGTKSVYICNICSLCVCFSVSVKSYMIQLCLHFDIFYVLITTTTTTTHTYIYVYRYAKGVNTP